jgi:hypothetical protein
MIKNQLGRPPKVTYLTLVKLARYIQNNYTVSDACLNARISRDTFYRYLNNEPEFTEMIISAYENQRKIPMYFDHEII